MTRSMWGDRCTNGPSLGGFPVEGRDRPACGHPWCAEWDGGHTAGAATAGRRPTDGGGGPSGRYGQRTGSHLAGSHSPPPGRRSVEDRFTSVTGITPRQVYGSSFVRG
ncbi:hypothetical protein STXM2123_5351 [Streptomyces sp. F-3]|nr:hypothetical protein STXM2123_5351 [Streptomyces sp. F-3]